MLKNKVESLLFSSGRKMSIEEISKLSHAKPEEVKNALAELKLEYDDRGSSVMVVNEGDSWKLTTREQYLPLVQKIVTETELSKTIMETLAVIAFKYPIKQSNLIKIRTNKAYDHLIELEELGYISRVKYGRTKLIKLTQKFFEYFNLPEEKVKEVFKDFASIAKAIENKEKEIETIKEEQRKEAEEEKQKSEAKEVDLVDKEGHEVALETYGAEKKQEETQVTEEKPSEEETEEVKEDEQQQEKSEEVEEKESEESEKDKEQIEETEKEKEPEIEGGIKVTKEMEKIIDEKVDKMLHPPKEEETQKEQESEKKKEKSKPEEESKDLLEAEMEEKEKEKNKK